MGAFTASDDTKGTAEPSGWSRSPWTLAILAVLVVAALPVGAHASVPRHLVPSPDAAAAFAEARAPARAPSLAPIELADDTYEIVVTKDGATHAGRLVRMDNGVIVLQTADGHTDRIPMAQVASVHLQAAPPPARMASPRHARPIAPQAVASAQAQRIIALRRQLEKERQVRKAAKAAASTGEGLVILGLILGGFGLPLVLADPPQSTLFIFGAILSGAGGVAELLGIGFWPGGAVQAARYSRKIHATEAELQKLSKSPQAVRSPAVSMVTLARF